MRRALIAILCFLLPALMTAAILGKRLLPAPRAASGPRLFTVRRGNVTVRVTETGTVEPRTRVEVKSKVGGKVLELLAAEGARVRIGQVLAVLDPIEQQSQVGQIRAQVTAAEARLKQAVSQASTERLTAALAIEDARQQLRTSQARLEQAARQARVQPQ